MTINPIHSPLAIPQIERILVPIDFSEASHAAFCRALEVAKIYRSCLWLVHVLANPTSLGMANVLPGAIPELKEELQADLDKLHQVAAMQGISCITLLREGSVFEHVRDIVGRNHIDLLVLATHGGRGVHGLFLGSTAERLIRTTSIPGLTIGIAKDQPSWAVMGARHIVFVGDFSPETRCGFDYALRIRQRTGARLSVIRVVPPGTCPDVIDALRSEIQAFVPAETDVHLPIGKTGVTVCRVAREIQASLLTLGVHKNSFTREIFGSCLREILLTAPCPVLTVRQCGD
jgi:nucleotide-binding universal stress UspA family protein